MTGDDRRFEARRVERGTDLAPIWNAVASPHYQAEAGWLAAMGGRIPGEAWIFALTRNGRDDIAVYGTAVEDPAAYEAYNLATILFARQPVFELAEPAMARRLSAPVPGSATHVFPNLVLCLPGYQSAFVGPQSRDRAAQDLLVAEIVRWATRRELRAVSALYVSGGDDAWALRERALATTVLTYRAILTRRGARLEDHLASLSSRRRQEIRRQLRRIGDTGASLGEAPLTAWAEDVVSLRVAALRRFGHAGDPEQEAARLQALVGAFGMPRLRLFVLEHERRLLAYCLFLASSESWHAVWASTSQADAGARYGYFATAFYEPLDVAPPTVLHMDYGISHLAPKVRFGCVPEPLHASLLWAEPSIEDLLRSAMESMEPAPASSSEDRER